MAMAAKTAPGCAPSVSSLSTQKPFNALHRPNSSKPISFPITANPNLTRLRLRVSGLKPVIPKPAFRVLAVSESNSEAELNDSSKDATIDIKLPRRNLRVQFTCDECGERTQRLINRLAYERGLVFVQCAGCLRHHKLVDNLGLVVEYDFREDINMESSTDQVG